jgi:hemerythrin-like domain-containing protein
MSSTPASDNADLTGYHLVHTALRGGIARLVAATGPDAPASSDMRRNKAIARYWKGYAGEIRVHHHTEDEFIFPALTARVSDMAPKTDRTGQDHVELDRMLEEGDAAMLRVAAGSDPRDAGSIMAAIGEHLDEHLTFEDVEILPVIEVSFTDAEYKELDDQAIKEVGIGKQAAFTVPFALAATTPAEFRVMWGKAPMPLKVLWYLTRGSHARMVRRAFGADAG